MRKSAYLIPLIAAGTLTIPASAWAQGTEAAPAPAAAPAAPAEAAPAAPAAPAEAAPAAEPAPMAEPAPAPPPPPPPAEEPMAAEATMPAAPAAPAEAAPAEEEEGGVPGWFRMDSDLLTLQLWFGASHDVGGVNIATDIYVDSFDFAEFDLGVEVPLGDSVLLIPMAGIGFNWQQYKPSTLIAPQLFGYFDFDPIYIEWWSQFFITSIFADAGYSDDGTGTDTYVENSELAPNTWYNRLFLLYHATENFSIGPQVEATIALNDAAKSVDPDSGDDSALASLPVGGRVNLGYGENNTLGLFLGYETVKGARLPVSELDSDGEEVGPNYRGLVGRFTFVRTW